MNTITLFIFLVPVVVLVLLLRSVLFAPVKPDAEKTLAYECGFSAITGQTRSPFSIAYYVVAMLFLVFDIEVRLRFPLAQTLYTVQATGFWVAMLFFFILTLGFVFELGSGALDFTNQRSSTIHASQPSTIPSASASTHRNSNSFNGGSTRSFSTGPGTPDLSNTEASNVVNNSGEPTSINPNDPAVKAFRAVLMAIYTDKRLLAPVSPETHNKGALDSIGDIERALTGLPSGPLRQWIETQLSYMVEVVGNVNTKGQIEGGDSRSIIDPKPIGKKPWVYQICAAANLDSRYYIGSSLNPAYRRGSHARSFATGDTAQHRALNEIAGKVSNVLYAKVYTVTNLFTAFRTINPTYQYIEYERHLLMCMTQLITGTLEQSLIYAYWDQLINANKEVVFMLVTAGKFKNFFSKPLEIRDTRGNIVRLFDTMADACMWLNIDRRTLNWYCNNVAQLHSTVLDAIVTIGNPGISPIEKPQRPQSTPISERGLPVLTLPNQELTDLGRGVWIISSDKTNLYGPYASLIAASIAMFPNKHAITTTYKQSYYRTRPVSKAANWEYLLVAENGNQYYVAYNPNFKPKQGFPPSNVIVTNPFPSKPLPLSLLYYPELKS